MTELMVNVHVTQPFMTCTNSEVDQKWLVSKINSVECCRFSYVQHNDWEYIVEYQPVSDDISALAPICRSFRVDGCLFHRGQNLQLLCMWTQYTPSRSDKGTLSIFPIIPFFDRLDKTVSTVKLGLSLLSKALYVLKCTLFYCSWSSLF